MPMKRDAVIDLCSSNGTIRPEKIRQMQQGVAKICFLNFCKEAKIEAKDICFIDNVLYTTLVSNRFRRYRMNERYALIEHALETRVKSVSKYFVVLYDTLTPEEYELNNILL